MMLCRKCLEDGMVSKVIADKRNILLCEKLHECSDPIVEEEDICLLKIASRYDRIYKLPLGYAIDQAPKSEIKLGMFLTRIYQRWVNNYKKFEQDNDNKDDKILPEKIVEVTIRMLLNFSKENTSNTLSELSQQLINACHEDLAVLLAKANLIMDMMLVKAININSLKNGKK